MKQLKPKNRLLSIYCILLFVVIAVMSQRCGSASDSTNSESDTLRVAIELSPTGLTTVDDTLAGFHYDMIRSIAKMGNRPTRISGFTNLKSALSGLENGTYDIVVSDIPATSKMKEKYLLTEPVYIDHQVLVRRSEKNDSTSFNHFDLARDTVWIPAGSPFADRINNLAREIDDTIFIVEDTEYGSEQLVILTALGEIKQAVVNEEVARRIANDYPVLDISTSVSFNQFQTWTIAADNQSLCDSINSWLLRFQATPAYENLLKKYFPDNHKYPLCHEQTNSSKE